MADQGHRHASDAEEDHHDRITLGVARRHCLPVLMPLDPAAYASMLEWGPAALSLLYDLRDDLVASGGVGADHFMMSLTYQDEAPDRVYRQCNAPGEVSVVHPNDAAWRIAEYEWARAGAVEVPDDVVLSDFRTAWLPGGGGTRAVKPAPVSGTNTSGRHVLRCSARAGPAMMAP